MAERGARPDRKRGTAGVEPRRPRELLWLCVPLLFSSASLVSFYAANAGELAFADIAPTLGWYSLGVAAVTAVVYLVLRDVFRTVVLVSMMSAAFFYYGYLYRTMAGVSIGVGRYTVGPDMVLWAAIAVLLVVLTVFVFRKRERTLLAAKTLAVIGLSLMLTSAGLAVAARAELDEPDSGADVVASAGEADALDSDVSTTSVLATGGADATATPGAAGEKRDTRAPDIFYIVLDGYASNSSIAEFSGYDNSQFTEFLEQRGFYVARDSKANYSTTFLSLAATTNMRYLTEELEGLSGTNRARFYGMVKNNRVARKLTRNGYRYIHVASGWGSTNSAPLADRVLKVGGSEIDLAVNDATMFRPFNDKSMSKKKYRAVRKAFDHLNSIKSSSRRPTFVWAHILAPHGPYVFGADGRFYTGNSTDMKNWRPAQKDNYIAQMQAINRLTERFVANRLKVSKRPLIIIIQGDHGTTFPAKKEKLWLRRHSVLNAMYFSEGTPEALYPSISPVNTFRVVLDEAIGSKYRLLPDRYYHSLNYSRPYDLTDVTKTLKKAEAPAP
jgi:hypothetical protein